MLTDADKVPDCVVRFRCLPPPFSDIFTIQSNTTDLSERKHSCTILWRLALKSLQNAVEFLCLFAVFVGSPLSLHQALKDFQKTAALQLLAVLALSLITIFNLFLHTVFTQDINLSLHLISSKCVWTVFFHHNSFHKIVVVLHFLISLSYKPWGFYLYFKNVFKCVWAGFLCLTVETLTAVWHIPLQLEKC